MHPLLEIKNLRIDFVQDNISTRAVQNVSFTAYSGKLTAIVGESGSGKSVTALSILQLVPTQAKVQGEILFSPGGGKPVALEKLSPKEITQTRGSQVSMVFQEPMTSLNPLLTCGYQVMETLIAHRNMPPRQAKEETIRLFEQVELPDPQSLFKRYPHQVSGGQKQRVMIAMAMSCKPALLIADEPTTALDVRVQQNILLLVKKLQQQHNMGVLLITHDLDLVADIADEIIVMYKGSIVEQGNAASVLTNPQHNYTRALLACRPRPNQKGKRLAVLKDFLLEQTIEKKHTQAVDPPRAKPGTATVPLLSVRDLKVYFPAAINLFGKPRAFFKAVDGISFDVMRSETIGLVGESGCGKTTLGRAILQLIKPTEGKIILSGNELTTMASKDLREMRKDLQVVFQDPYGSLNPRISIGKAILEPLEVHKLYGNSKARKEVVIDTLEKVQLPADLYNRYPHQFSGGQRQRICIARALVMNPSFLVFDESVSALDISVQASILNLVNDLKQAYQFTSIFISHDLSVVHYISDRILVMNKGKIIEQGPADEIYFNPAVEYTQKLIDAIPGRGRINPRNHRH